MNWFGVLRNVALVVVVGSLWGCSQQDKPAEQQQRCPPLATSGGQTRGRNLPNYQPLLAR